jgi:hypothetical protein
MTYYTDKLAEGQKFEEYIKKVFFERFTIYLDFTGKENQIKIGETLQGIEVKFDNKYKETGNVYIEVAEKTNPDNPEYVKSGIYREDNTWLYVIGDYQTLYMFSKKHLKLLKDKCQSVITPTSMGFLVPEELAKKECIIDLTGMPAQ